MPPVIAKFFIAGDILVSEFVLFFYKLSNVWYFVFNHFNIRIFLVLVVKPVALGILLSNSLTLLWKFVF